MQHINIWHLFCLQVKISIQEQHTAFTGCWPTICARPHLHVHVVLPVSLPALILPHGQRIMDGSSHVTAGDTTMQDGYQICSIPVAATQVQGTTC